jgi:hypothetical protein
MNPDDFKCEVGNPWNITFKETNGYNIEINMETWMEMLASMKLPCGSKHDGMGPDDELNKTYNSPSSKSSKPVDKDWGLKLKEVEEDKVSSGLMARTIKLDAQADRLKEWEQDLKSREADSNKERDRLTRFAAELARREKEIKEREDFLAEADRIATALDTQE